MQWLRWQSGGFLPGRPGWNPAVSGSYEIDSEFISLCVEWSRTSCNINNWRPLVSGTKVRRDYRSRLAVIVSVINIWWRLNVIDIENWITNFVRSRHFSEKCRHFLKKFFLKNDGIFTLFSRYFLQKRSLFCLIPI